MLQSKSVQISDYDEMGLALSDITRTVGQEKDLKAIFYFPHEHRWWEYASALTAFYERYKEHKAQLSVLDAGAGHSVLGPTVALCYFSTVYEIELSDKVLEGRACVKIPGLSTVKKSILDLNESNGLFDAVFCISVIEHIPEWEEALKKLMNRVKPGGLLVVTTDYGKSAEEAWDNDSERENKFVEVDLRKMADILKEGGFKFESPDYTFHGAEVFDYTFYRFIAIKESE